MKNVGRICKWGYVNSSCCTCQEIYDLNWIILIWSKIFYELYNILSLTNPPQYQMNISEIIKKFNRIWFATFPFIFLQSNSTFNIYILSLTPWQRLWLQLETFYCAKPTPNCHRTFGILIYNDSKPITMLIKFMWK